MTITELNSLADLLREMAMQHAGCARDAQARDDQSSVSTHRHIAEKFSKGAADLTQLADAFSTLTPLLTSQK